MKFVTLICTLFAAGILSGCESDSLSKVPVATNIPSPPGVKVENIKIQYIIDAGPTKIMVTEFKTSEGRDCVVEVTDPNRSSNSSSLFCF